MKYFDTEFRKFLEDLLGAFRKFLEQARISSKDQNYIILVNETVGKVDKAVKIVKPSAFDFLSVGKIQKLQEDEFLKQKAVELEQSFEERVKAETENAAEELRKSIRSSLEKEFEARAESEKAAITEQLKSSIGAEYESEYVQKVADIEKEYAEKVAALRREYDEKLKAEIERITAEMRVQVRDELSKTMTEELSQKLRKEIKAELKQEREEKKKRKKAKKEAQVAEALAVEQQETDNDQSQEKPVLMKPPDAQKPPSENSPAPIIRKEKDFGDDEFDNGEKIDKVE